MLDRDLKKGWIGNDNGVWALTKMELPLGQKKIVINEQRPAYLFLGGNVNMFIMIFFSDSTVT